MRESSKKNMPDIMEAIFDAGYLIFDLIAGILFFVFSKGNPLFILYGVLTLTLCGGDAFHLVPRIIRAVHGSSEKIKRQLGIGLQVSSITMTVFYIILLYVWKLTFPELNAPATVEAMIWISAIIRIVVCFLPQNNWCTDDGNMKLSILRNAVFAVTGIGVIILYAISGNANGYHMTRMVAAIIISFGCYLPVTLFSKTKPKVGLLMIPKTCAYMWIFVTGLTQNVEELLKSDTARLMLANSEFLILLNQATTDRDELAALLNISDNQLSYITNVGAGHGLIRCSGNLVPFENSFPRNTKLYRLMTTKPGEA